MVYMIPAEKCMCGVCLGGEPAPPGMIGGTVCSCRCHALLGKAKEEWITARAAERKQKLEAALIEAFPERK